MKEDNVEIGLGFEASLMRKDLHAGVLLVQGIIGEEYAIFIDRELREVIRSQGSPGQRPLNVQLFSGGGGVYPSFHVYDSLRSYAESVGPVTVIASGLVASAAAGIILQAGDKRLVTPNARVMLHEVGQWYMHGTGVATSQHEDSTREMKTLQRMMCEILRQRTHRDADYWQTVIERKEAWYSAAEAIELGLADGIASAEKLVLAP